MRKKTQQSWLASLSTAKKLNELRGEKVTADKNWLKQSLNSKLFHSGPQGHIQV